MTSITMYSTAHSVVESFETKSWENCFTTIHIFINLKIKYIKLSIILKFVIKFQKFLSFTVVYSCEFHLLLGQSFRGRWYVAMTLATAYSYIYTGRRNVWMHKSTTHWCISVYHVSAYENTYRCLNKDNDQTAFFFKLLEIFLFKKNLFIESKSSGSLKKHFVKS